MACEWWELHKCCWQTNKIHSPLACGSLWLSSTSKEKNSQTSPFILSWAAFHKCRRLVSSMSADCILLLIGMTFQEVQIVIPEASLTFSDYSNLMVRLITLPRPSPGWQPESEGSAGIPHHFFSPFPSTANVLGAQTENSNNHSSVFESFKSLGTFPNYETMSVLSKPELNEMCPPQLALGQTLH